MSTPPDRMGESERILFMILTHHDLDIATRNEQRTETMWPDLSDIHTRTRQRIFTLFQGSLEDVRRLAQEVGLHFQEGQGSGGT
jgi:hypothetical protein